MNTPPSAEQRLKVSRALCQQALRQPAWVLLAQRVCAPSASCDPARPSMAAGLWDRCIKSFLDYLHNAHVGQREKDHAQHQGPR